jgi:WD40 repeat protein/serine/threonine protein kinase
MNPFQAETDTQEQRFNRVVAAYLEAVDAGETPDRQQWLARYPEFALLLADFFAARDRLHRFGNVLREPRPSEILPGCNRAFGDYELLEKLGQGGMGAIYKARQKKLSRLVALKVVRTDFLSEADIQRFRNEAEMVANLDHAHIVPIHEVGEHDGRLYFSMKLMEGGSLKEVAARSHAAGVGGQEAGISREACRRAAHWVATVARAVHHAHQRGILHRDLKPSNILLDTDGRPHVTDFGLAKRIEVGSSLTESGVLVGTPSYMAPEQAAGKRAAITTATDVYGLGAILYTLLTGRPPFQGHSLLDTLEQVQQREPDLPSKANRWVDRDLETICLKCLEKEPERRYSSAEALAEDLERILTGKPIQARPVSPGARIWRWCKRNRTIAGLTVLAGLLLAAGVVGLLVSTLLIAAEQKQTKAALDQAEGQRRLAEAQRKLAEERELDVRVHLYAAHISQARRLWEQGEREQALSLLSQHIPASGQSDVRDFEWYYLQRLCRGQAKERRSLRGHSGQVYCAVFAPDGKILATAGQDRTVWLRDPASGQPAAKLEGHTNEVNWAAFSPDGKALATASDDGTVRVWDAATGRMQRQLLQVRDKIVGVAFAPDGKSLAVGQDDGTLRLLEFPSGSEQVSIRAHPRRIEFVAFSPDGRLLATAGHHDGVRLWQLPTLRQAVKLDYPSDWAPPTGPRCLAFAHSSPLLAIGSIDMTVRLLDLVSGRMLAIFRGHSARVQSVAFAPDDRTLASSGDDGTVRIWDVPSGRVRNILTGHAGAVWTVAFAPNGKSLATAGEDAIVRLWDPAVRLDCVALPGHQQGICAVAFDSKGSLLATAGEDATMRLWDYKAGRLRSATPISGDMNEIPLCLAFSSDSQRLAVGLVDGRAGHFHGRALILDVAGKRKAVWFRVAQEHGVAQVAFLDEDKTLMTNAGGKLQLWDAATGQSREEQRGLAQVWGGLLPWQRTAKPWPSDRAIVSCLGSCFGTCRPGDRKEYCRWSHPGVWVVSPSPRTKRR